MSELLSELEQMHMLDICERCKKPFREEERHQHPSRLTSPRDRHYWRCGVDVPWQVAQHAADEASIEIIREATGLP